MRRSSQFCYSYIALLNGQLYFTGIICCKYRSIIRVFQLFITIVNIIFSFYFKFCTFYNSAIDCIFLYDSECYFVYFVFYFLSSGSIVTFNFHIVRCRYFISYRSFQFFYLIYTFRKLFIYHTVLSAYCRCYESKFSTHEICIRIR